MSVVNVVSACTRGCWNLGTRIVKGRSSLRRGTAVGLGGKQGPGLARDQSGTDWPSLLATWPDGQPPAQVGETAGKPAGKPGGNRKPGPTEFFCQTEPGKTGHTEFVSRRHPAPPGPRGALRPPPRR